MLIFFVESIVLCLIFTLTVPLYGLCNPLAMIDDYPPAIQARVRELGLIPAERTKKRVAAKLVFCLIAAAALAVIHRLFNGANTFRSGFPFDMQNQKMKLVSKAVSSIIEISAILS